MSELDCHDTPSFIAISNQGAPENLRPYCVDAVFLIKLCTSKKFVDVNVIFSLTVICKLINEFEFFQRKRLEFLEQLRKNFLFFHRFSSNFKISSEDILPGLRVSGCGGTSFSQFSSAYKYKGYKYSCLALLQSRSLAKKLWHRDCSAF